MNETLGGERLSDLQDGGTITRLRAWKADDTWKADVRTDRV